MTVKITIQHFVCTFVQYVQTQTVIYTCFAHRETIILQRYDGILYAIVKETIKRNNR
jgi:hypothetical protein